MQRKYLSISTALVTIVLVILGVSIGHSEPGRLYGNHHIGVDHRNLVNALKLIEE